MENPRFGRFIHYYRAAKKTDAPVNFWERVVYSLLLSTVKAGSEPADLGSATYAQGGGGQALCARGPRPFRSSRGAYPYQL